MTVSFHLPPTGFGPGSQPTAEDGQELDYLALPSGMRVFEAHLPEIEDEVRFAPALALLEEIARACDEAARLGIRQSFPLAGLDTANRALIAETLGEGEVAAMITGRGPVRAQESVFAGIWTVRAGEETRIEVAPVPRDITRAAHIALLPPLAGVMAASEGVVNAPAIIEELIDRSQAYVVGDTAHVVNLTLLPHTPEDLEHIERALGTGSVQLLSRGYGNCRVASTATPHVWHVQFFNSMDALILDTYEVSHVPEVVLAAKEDFEDSAARLFEVLETIR